MICICFCTYTSIFVNCLCLASIFYLFRSDALKVGMSVWNTQSTRGVPAELLCHSGLDLLLQVPYLVLLLRVSSSRDEDNDGKWWV